jgi:MoaD family protein
VTGDVGHESRRPSENAKTEVDQEMVKLRLFSALREIAGAKEVEVEGEDLSIKAALERFADRFGERAKETVFDAEGEIQRSVLLLVNGERAEEGAATRVKCGDTVAVLLPTAGG